MKRLYLNKALLWKEWQQHRWSLLAGLLFMLPVYPISNFLMTLIFHSPLMAMEVWQRRMNGYDSPMPELVVVNAFVVLMLGIVLIASERRASTIEFLAATPVSRREIVVNKYAIGVVFIVSAQLLSFLTLAIISLCTHANVMGPAPWYFGVTMVLLALFSVAFFTATVTGHFLAATGLTVLMTYSPLFLMIMLNNGLISFLQDREWYTSMREGLFRLAERVTLFTYLGLEPVSMHRLIDEKLTLFFGMLLVCAIALILSVICFEKNAFERNGRWLMFGNTLTIAKVVVTVLVTIPVFIVASGGPVWFALLVTLLTGVVCVRSVGFVPRVWRRVGAR